MILPGRIVETDGIGALLQAVVCAWCKTPMGAKVCEASMAGRISHGLCPACMREQLCALRLPAAPENEATAAQAKTPPGAEPLQVTGTADSAGVMIPPQVVEHAGARPVASFTFLLVALDDLSVWAALDRSERWVAKSNFLLAHEQSLCRWMRPELHREFCAAVAQGTGEREAQGIIAALVTNGGAA